jgi:hypothetical protein
MRHELRFRESVLRQMQARHPRRPVVAFAISKLVSFEHRKASMHRLIARSLLLVVFVGNFGPLTLAATAAPHACCVRKVHRCHDSPAIEQSSQANQLVIRAVRCCNHDCCRAVTTARWAHAQPPMANSLAQNVEGYLGQSSPVLPNTEVSRFQSTRAPPAC